MSLRDDPPAVLASDARYSLSAYVFVFAALKHLRKKRKGRPSSGPRSKRQKNVVRHVTGQELCRGALDLALSQYGLLAKTVLAQWGIHSTSDLGDVVYNLIASGELDKTPEDSRADFDDVFDFDEAFDRDFTISADALGD